MIKYTFKKSLYLILFVFFLQFSLAYPLEFGEVGVSDSLELSISDEMIFWDFPAGGIAIITDFNYEITGPDSNEFYICGFDWNAKDMGSGLYFYKLTIKDKTFIKKMILMR